ncbi:ATP-binding protein [Neorhizobium alkalisoli]|uniref:histidine kinase n=1 Tax=Neorhizobium alkalisoli TaxID=528178 RepID=A0A561QSP1_9HYPH|nr:ATP-binding protein [Neorhizobium alkalisoli]TWF53415.1 PAS domain S-box-containing protein [Neorhizobium alkalisoli]
MSAVQYPFIDIAVNERVRARFSAGEGMVLFSSDMRYPLWANGQGAGLFGFSSIYDFIDQGPNRNDVAFRQIEATARQLARTGDTRNVVVRVTSGFQRVIIQGVCELVEISGERAVLFSAATAQSGTSPEICAARMIEGFEDPDTYMAVFDKTGKVIAASARFAELDISQQTIGMLSAMADGDPSRLAKRPISTVKGYLPAAMGKLADDPAFFLLFTVDMAEDDIPSAQVPEPVSAAPVVVDAVSENAVVLPPENGGETEALDAIAEIEEAPEQQDEISLFDEEAPAPAEADSANDVGQTEADVSNATEAVTAEAENESAELPISDETAPELEEEAISLMAEEPAAPGEEDSSALIPTVSPEDEETALDADADVAFVEPAAPEPQAVPADEPLHAATASAVDAPSDTENFSFRSEARATRFVWKIDATGHFTEVSSEFAATVGPHAADIIGMAFSDMAALFHLDPEGRIIELLNKRDTWSGKTIWWPVEGTSLIVPVDLAALPTYTRSREFDGFRGFGIVRIADAAEDPHAIGLSLVPSATEDFAADDELDTVEADEQATNSITADKAEEIAFIDKAYDTLATGYSEPVEGIADETHDEIVAENDEADDFAAETQGQDEAPAPTLPLNPATDWPNGERPALRLVDNPGRRQSDKIIQLEEHRTRLTPVEQAAFREIARQLDRFVGGEDNAAATQDAAAVGSAQNIVATDDASTADVSPIAADATEASTEAVNEAVATPDQTSPEQDVEVAVSADQQDESELSEDQNTVSEQADGHPVAESVDPVVEDAPAEEIAAVDAHSGAAAIESEAAAEPEAAEDLPAAPEDEPVVTDEQDLTEQNEIPAEEEIQKAETEPLSATPTDDDAHSHLSDRELLQTMLPIRERIGLSADIVDQMPVALLVHSGDTLIHGNPEFLKLTGYASLEELDAVGGLDALLQRQDLDDKTSGAGSMVVVKANDDILPVTAKLQSVRWGDNSALMLVLMPIASETEAAGPVEADGQAEIIPFRNNRPADQLARLQVEVEELRAILETATDGVVIIDASGEVRSMNRAASALFNYDDDEINGKPFVMLFAHESQRAIIDYLSGLSGHGVASVLNDGREVIGREASGGFLPLFMTIGKLTSSNGYCAVIRDITQWKRTEDELRTAKRAAETANAHKSEFLAHVSHEIRTPLNAIIGFADMMAGERFGPIGHPRYVEYSNDIGRSGRHVLDIVNDLLDISKIEAGEMEMDFTSVGLNETVSEAVSLVQPQANSQRVIIRTALSQAVPPVVADLRSIKQIVLNILSNAIRFTPSGGQIVVSSAYEPNGNVVLRVRDTGIGMTRSELELAMKPFRQVAGAARKRGDGTGLGLPLTKAMVDANRAAFAISSAPNEGTLVEITFPSPRVLAT